jgi:hypothetical protein
MFRRKTTVLIAILSLAIGVAPAFAGKGHGNATAADPPCSVSGSTVTANSLPTDQVINFMISDAGGTTGWVLGFTSDGSWSVNVPARNGTTTYEFASRTWGPGGSKYSVFSSCSA